MTSQSYQIGSKNGTGYARIVATAEPCKRCHGPKAVGGFWEDFCPTCRMRLALIREAREAGAAVKAFAAAVRDGRPAVAVACECCGAPADPADLFDVFGIGRCCLRCVGMDDAAPDGRAPCAGCGRRPATDGVLCGPCRDGVRRALGGRCPECNGNGWVPDRSHWSDGAATEDCPACGGTGSGVAA